MARHGTTTTGSTGHSAGNKMATAAALPWILLNMLIFCVLIGLASNLINSYFNSAGTLRILDDPINVVLVLFTLLSSSVGLATMIMALVHGGKSRDSGAKFSSLSSNLITFALVMLSFGFACKAISRSVPGGESTNLGRQVTAIAALDIIVGATMLAYLFTLGLFKTHDNTYNTNTTTGATTTHPGDVATGPKMIGGHEARAPAV
ncbi:hypothetical protein JKP88DRAFT_264123 [Tribonema minus]|uniref:Uncharacterized protein n=1 Tax=Tribonema minus TaxID=303371 RepID=A0A836CB80_9STRA|nr:hypothetical protein JKP88DRAFT_264123 [Tribonema minus]